MKSMLITFIVCLPSIVFAGDCEVLKEAMAAASSGFASIRGAESDRIDDTTYFDSSLQMDMLPRCQIMFSEGKYTWTCNNGVGRNKRVVDYGEVGRLATSCGFRIRDTQSSSSGTSYEIVTDQRTLVRLRTSFSNRLNRAVIFVSQMR